MRKKEKAENIQKILDETFPNPPIPLNHKDPFTLLVAVMLSAQTTDKQVNKVTPALFQLADTPKKMAKLSVSKIHSIIRTCGLAPTKAKALRKMSEQLLEKHGGKVPKTFEELESLAGVGHKTASVVMAQAFHTPAFPVDTHIHRCAKRWGLTKGKTREQTEKDLKILFPKKDWIKLHLQMIYFAREYCQAKQHNPKTCPICSRLSRNKVC